LLTALGCNDSELATGDADSSQPGNPNGDPDDTDPGLEGGHFDLDTASGYYDFDHGTTDHHVHRYDDVYNVLSVDFFDMLDAGFTEIASNVAPAQELYVIVGNAQLSPMVTLEINGTAFDVGSYQQKVIDFKNGASSLETYSLAGGGSRLTSLRLVFDPGAIVNGGLVATETACVRENDPGLYGEYRNGALLVQILDKATATIDPVTNTATANGALLWEATVFWHKPQASCL
jgi:hypothetical protein